MRRLTFTSIKSMSPLYPGGEASSEEGSALTELSVHRINGRCETQRCYRLTLTSCSVKKRLREQLHECASKRR
ncbi:hypothetical protein YC2023_095133 [Brassica napus]